MTEAAKARTSPTSFAEGFTAALIVSALILIQVLIGGTRLLFSFPAYCVLAPAALVALLTWRRAKPSPSRACLWSSAIFFGYIIVRAVYSPVVFIARADLYVVLAALILYLLVACVLTASVVRMWMSLALIVFALAHVLVGAIQFRFGNNYMPISFLQRVDYGYRASGFYICPNHLAGLLEVVGVIGLSIVCWSRWPVWAKMLIAYCASVCYLGQLLSGSRGGFLSAGASLFVFLILSAMILRQAGGKVFWRLSAATLIGLIIVGAGIAYFFHANEHMAERTNIIDKGNIRLDLWKGALQQWKLQPLLGTGSGTYLYYGRMFRTDAVQLDPAYVHNDYLHLLAEYGALSGLLFLIFLGTHLWNGWKNFQRLGPRRVKVSAQFLSNSMALQIGALAAVAAYIVHSGFDFNLHIPANVLLLAFVFAILANAGNGRSEPGKFRPWQIVAPALAIVLVIQAVRLLPGEYFTERARVMWTDDKLSEAIVWAERGVRYEKQNPDLYDYLGRSRSDLADTLTDPAKRKMLYQGAITAFETGRALAPMDETFPMEMGFAYDDLGRFPEAEWMFDQALALDPKSTSLQQYYGTHLARWSGREPEGSENKSP
jgi:O-antigen ligase